MVQSNYDRNNWSVPWYKHLLNKRSKYICFYSLSHVTLGWKEINLWIACVLEPCRFSSGEGQKKEGKPSEKKGTFCLMHYSTRILEMYMMRQCSSFCLWAASLWCCGSCTWQQHHPTPVILLCRLSDYYPWWEVDTFEFQA